MTTRGSDTPPWQPFLTGVALGALGGIGIYRWFQDAQYDCALIKISERYAQAVAALAVEREATAHKRITDSTATPAEAGSVQDVVSFDPVQSGSSGSVDVVLSYQSRSEALMLRIRRAMQDKGLIVFDGKQIPAGGDWRQHYFAALKRASVFVPVQLRVGR